ncbi:MAG: HDOD domain-containing protein [Planctomycetes bacterium]|nr:HDOD domain-containing protein [Planctomycetota bacterium]
MNALERRIQGISDLPPLPRIVTELQALLADSATTARDVGALISRDPALATKLLKIANSPFYAPAREITTISGAVVLLGFQAVRGIVLAVSIAGALGRQSSRTGFDRPAFWEHSFAVGAIAREIAKRRGETEMEEYFVAGLVHDLGKVVLDKFLPAEFTGVVERVAGSDGQMSMLAAERELLGTDHTRVGEIVLRRWGLPDQIVGAVRYHHEPGEADSSAREVAAVHLADVVARTVMIGNGGDMLVPAPAPGTLPTLGMEPGDVDMLISMAATEREWLAVFAKG